VFSLKELHSATNNFNYDNKLGEGGFGSVYWGQLWDGSQVRLFAFFFVLSQISSSLCFFVILVLIITAEVFVTVNLLTITLQCVPNIMTICYLNNISGSAALSINA
jgi:hypothetical protein